MNKRIITITLLILFAGLNKPASAQWDLGGTVPINSTGVVDSAGVGVPGSSHLQPNSVNANGSPGQPYLNEPNAIQPNRSQAIYNQNGVVQNPSQQYVTNPRVPGILTPTSVTQFGSGQVGGPPGLPGLPAQLQKYSRNGLPPTRLDSFVKEAGGAADHIYGDEGTTSWPRQNGFSEADTINAGITGSNNKTLTTGHASRLPSPSQVNMNSPGDFITQSGPRGKGVRASTSASASIANETGMNYVNGIGNTELNTSTANESGVNYINGVPVGPGIYHTGSDGSVTKVGN